MILNILYSLREGTFILIYSLNPIFCNYISNIHISLVSRSCISSSYSFLYRIYFCNAVYSTLNHLKEETWNEPDLNDRASVETETTIELRTRDRYRKLIDKIESALERINKGNYGYCEETGEAIGIKRLEARPVATLCIEAQERHENYEKTHIDEDLLEI